MHFQWRKGCLHFRQLLSFLNTSFSKHHPPSPLLPTSLLYMRPSIFPVVYLPTSVTSGHLDSSPITDTKEMSPKPTLDSPKSMRSLSLWCTWLMDTQSCLLSCSSISLKSCLLWNCPITPSSYHLPGPFSSLLLNTCFCSLKCTFNCIYKRQFHSRKKIALTHSSDFSKFPFSEAQWMNYLETTILWI